MSRLLFETTVDSPIGPLTVVASQQGLCAISWESLGLPRSLDDPVLRETARQLDEYFGGRRRDFDLPLDLRGSRFQLLVWRALAHIPYGTTSTYGDQARRLGRPRAARAVGAANGSNPLPIVLPCHRVIGSNGALTGYGGGLAAKRWLLELESTVVGGRLPLGTT